MDNQTDVDDGPQKIILGINSLQSRPLIIEVPAEHIVIEDDTGMPTLKVGFINSVDRVLRTLPLAISEYAYQILNRELGLRPGTGECTMWHARHWDDIDELATFNVAFPLEHLSPHVAGKCVLATSKYNLLANVALAPQIVDKVKMMVLVDGDGNLIFPTDRPLDQNGSPVDLGKLYVYSDQFPIKEQAEFAVNALRNLGYDVEAVADGQS